MIADIYIKRLKELFCKKSHENDSIKHITPEERSLWNLGSSSNGKGATGTLPIGTIFPCFKGAIPANAFRLNGQYILDCKDSYPEFWDWLGTNKNTLTFMTEDEYYAAIEEYGVCVGFIKNDAEGTVRLPTFEGLIDETKVSDTQKDMFSAINATPIGFVWCIQVGNLPEGFVNEVIETLNSIFVQKVGDTVTGMLTFSDSDHPAGRNVVLSVNGNVADANGDLNITTADIPIGTSDPTKLSAWITVINNWYTGINTWYTGINDWKSGIDGWKTGIDEWQGEIDTWKGIIDSWRGASSDSKVQCYLSPQGTDTELTVKQLTSTNISEYKSGYISSTRYGEYEFKANITADYVGYYIITTTGYDPEKTKYGDGTKDRPFFSINQACEYLRRFRASQTTTFEIIMLDGVYEYNVRQNIYHPDLTSKNVGGPDGGYLIIRGEDRVTGNSCIPEIIFTISKDYNSEGWQGTSGLTCLSCNTSAVLFRKLHIEYKPLERDRNTDGSIKYDENGKVVMTHPKLTDVVRSYWANVRAIAANGGAIHLENSTIANFSRGLYLYNGCFFTANGNNYISLEEDLSDYSLPGEEDTSNAHWDLDVTDNKAYVGLDLDGAKATFTVGPYNKFALYIENYRSSILVNNGTSFLIYAYPDANGKYGSYDIYCTSCQYGINLGPNSNIQGIVPQWYPHYEIVSPGIGFGRNLTPNDTNTVGSFNLLPANDVAPGIVYFVRNAEYVYTDDTKFVKGTVYYTLSGNTYSEAEVTIGAAVTPNTYFVHRAANAVYRWNGTKWEHLESVPGDANLTAIRNEDNSIPKICPESPDWLLATYAPRFTFTEFSYTVANEAVDIDGIYAKWEDDRLAKYNSDKKTTYLAVFDCQGLRWIVKDSKHVLNLVIEQPMTDTLDPIFTSDDNGITWTAKKSTATVGNSVWTDPMPKSYTTHFETVYPAHRIYCIPRKSNEFTFSLNTSFSI